ncbi:acetyltransferase [Mesorhizobium sanjuanii]|uniref:Acetyltransferase n=1 Tax=Mesorhizobium sanjuanii TaxID=2037900 RepID=A0A2A6F651_9HYPH|nr:MarR family winged helix-turn-helix transcriptional regulator [Mesorhizobium sanjuanii]PDQ17175.1 acetyltransferase [Mesorhizobium sanjuanii]
MPNERNALVTDIRRFNRFYTSWTGLLDETLTQSAYTLTEARVLFELDNRPGAIAAHPSGEAGFLARTFHLDIGPEASAMAAELNLAPAYVARILRKFAGAGLIEMRVDPNDRRRRVLALSTRGNAALAGLQAAADRDLGRLTAGLAGDEAAELSDALRKVMRLLGGPVEEKMVGALPK